MYSVQKRALDIAASLVGLVLLSPLLSLLAAAIKLDSSGPVIYKGVRVGRGGRPFPMWKFRSMVTGAALLGPSSTADDDTRVTRLGRFMRRFKLDELPQLVNVLRGEMSLVGPRPQVQWAVDLYSDEERTLLSIRPGITDPASIRFSNEGEILRGSTDPDGDYMRLIHPEKMRLNLEYIHRRSMLLDMKLVLQTVGLVGRSKTL